VLDPTGRFIVVPDLGADKVYVYAVGNSDNLRVTARGPIVVKGGSGPRHAAFAVRDGKTFMYLVTELTSSIIGYEVTYPAGSVAFKELFNIGSHGAGKPVSQTAYASEVVVSVSITPPLFLGLDPPPSPSLHAFQNLSPHANQAR
jgi:6-phosphogluconolactonase (cycloisomerase 2 family)